MTDSSHPRFIVGIDLGTTNCALAYIDSEEATADGAPPTVHVLQIEQLVKPGASEGRELLPSFLFVPAAAEKDKLNLELPWGNPGYATGVFARDRGAERPGCLVSSAKSWLCHSGVDRTAAILPWNTEEDVEKVSPLEASARYLRHLRDAFDHTVLGGDKKLIKKCGMAESQVVLTIPASFDAVARELTSRAAEMAGLTNLTLLEEPQAAFYAWLEQRGEKWRKDVSEGDVVLVCDIGGGTTDFSLIAVRSEGGDMQLDRVAVGDHTLVGGDNMDLLLAHTISQRIEKGDKTVKGGKEKLTTKQFLGLIRGCSRAKEKLLTQTGKGKASDVETISVLGSGSKVIGGAIKVELSRDDVEKLLVDGFVPACKLDDKPTSGPKFGLREVGLPWAHDAAITRHLAAFLARVTDNGAQHVPTHILFNGGVMKADRLRERLLETVGGWFGSGGKKKGEGGLSVLEDSQLDLACSLGAVAFGRTVRNEGGIRIRGGVAQTYYLGIAGAAPAVPGMAPPMRALTVLPFGTEEGSAVELPGHEFELVAGEEVEFPFLSSRTRQADPAGVFVDELDEIEEIARLTLSIGAKDKHKDDRGHIPVRLEARVTEVGTLEVWCVQTGDGDGRWKLEVSVRTTTDEG
ncbi:MAG: Hsp70 family protein [Planctomycetota bacterium]